MNQETPAIQLSEEERDALRKFRNHRQKIYKVSPYKALPHQLRSKGILWARTLSRRGCDLETAGNLLGISKFTVSRWLSEDYNKYLDQQSLEIQSTEETPIPSHIPLTVEQVEKAINNVTTPTAREAEVATAFQILKNASDNELMELFISRVRDSVQGREDLIQRLLNLM